MNHSSNYSNYPKKEVNENYILSYYIDDYPYKVDPILIYNNTSFI